MQTKYPVINWNKAAAKASEEKEFFSLASTPHNENCTQAGQDLESQILECTALINQLIRENGTPPKGADFFIVENTGHDFGTYYEAGIFYIPTADQEQEEDEILPPDHRESEIYASKIEAGAIPDNWDAEAKQELREAGHPAHQPAKVVRMKAA